MPRGRATRQGSPMRSPGFTPAAFARSLSLAYVSPRLSHRVGERQVTLTGILPRSEFQAKAAWGGAGVFARPIGCGAHADLPSQPADPKALARKRVIETLGETEAFVGA